MKELALSSLQPARGAKHKAKRVGRGPGSGMGKTSTRGGKGQTARAGGKIRAGFEGGQMPLYRRISKFGFTSRTRVRGENQFVIINLDFLENFEEGSVVDADSLKARGISFPEKLRGGLKILGRGTLSKKLTVKANAFTASAKSAIESKGGTAELI